MLNSSQDIVTTEGLDLELHEMLARASVDLRFQGKFFYNETFESPYSVLHHQIFDLIENGGQKVAIAAPRGIGKTSIARLVAQDAIKYRKANFIVYIQNSATLAEMQTENIKRSLRSNTMVRKIFGDIKMTTSGIDESFSKSAWVAYDDILVLPRGSGQQIRGLNFNSHRPELIIIDDLEDAKEIRNKEIRDAMWDWLLSDVLNSVNKYSKNYRVIYIDTLKHEDSVLQRVMDSSDWDHKVLSICDENFQTNDPNYMTNEEIALEVERYREKGRLDVFFRESMNKPISTIDAAFKQEYFKYYNEPDLMGNKDIETVVIGDPAKTAKMHNAESAVVVVGIDRTQSRIYVRDVIHGRFYPDDFYNELFLSAARFGASAIGVEVTGLEEFIKQPMKNEMIQRKQYYELVWLKARGGSRDIRGKELRIASLVPFYRQGQVFHNTECCTALEEQLMSFPRSKLWDIMDALAYIVEMMELGERYFEPPYEDPDEVEHEYDEIENEPAFEDWRYAI